MAQTIDFVSLLHKSQEYISENYAAALSDRSKIVQLRSYIEKYLHDSGFEVEGMTFRELADKLYSEMAEYSVLTKYLGRDEIEEININGWDDIAVTYTDGHIEKAKEHFYTAFAANDDPLTVVNNLSDFIFGLIRAIGLIMLGFGIVQVGLSLKSHDPSQRANGFLTVAGCIVITFAKEILNLITG